MKVQYEVEIRQTASLIMDVPDDTTDSKSIILAEDIIDNSPSWSDIPNFSFGDFFDMDVRITHKNGVPVESDITPQEQAEAEAGARGIEPLSPVAAATLFPPKESENEEDEDLKKLSEML